MDIVKWLREFKLSTSDSNYNALIVNAKTEEAADEIERLREELKISNDGWGFASLQIQVAKLEIERLRSDNKRLRDRMEKVADVLYDKGDMDAWAAVRNALWQDDE